MERFVNIKGYDIYVCGTWCEVTKDGKDIYTGSVAENMSPVSIYELVTAKVKFMLNGKCLASYDLLNTFASEKKATLELLASENNCSISDIKVINEVEEVLPTDVINKNI